MTVFINENKKICYAGTESMRATKLVSRLERSFADRSGWDARLASIYQVADSEIHHCQEAFKILFSERDPGIYVANDSYASQIAKRASLYTGLDIFTVKADAADRIEIGIGKAEDLDCIYYYLKSMLFELPFWI